MISEDLFDKNLLDGQVREVNVRKVNVRVIYVTHFIFIFRLLLYFFNGRNHLVIDCMVVLHVVIMRKEWNGLEGVIFFSFSFCWFVGFYKIGG